MASSKALFLLIISLLFALVLLVSSGVAADHKKESKKSNGVEEAKYGGPGYGNPGGGYNNGGHGGGYRGYPPRRGCPYGCCRRYRYSNDCYRCCSHANEAPDAEFEDDVKH